MQGFRGHRSVPLQWELGICQLIVELLWAVSGRVFRACTEMLICQAEYKCAVVALLQYCSLKYALNGFEFGVAVTRLSKMQMCMAAGDEARIRHRFPGPDSLVMTHCMAP